ncbi:hypothetical protein DFH29DRAFT_1015635 [Suillus ampliporus]|nr:hypothetical protein DFH29DRAFT_1015635 [Suillus ampliporus]
MGQTGLPQLPTPPIADLSPDASEHILPSRTPSPAGSNLVSEPGPGPLHDANSSTWAACNPTRLVIRPRTPLPRLSDAQKASRKIKRDQSNQTKYHTTCKVQLSNALVHAKAREMNTDLSVGSRYKLMKELTRDEKAVYKAALTAHRQQKLILVSSKLDDLHVRTGTYATLFVVRGHINDTIQSLMHGTDNSEDFWEDVYDLPMADYLRQYEQWACTQNQNLNERDSLETARKEVRKLIVHGLVAVTGKRDIAMNYTNYETAVVETYGVRLIGWPTSIKFVSPSNIGTVGDIRKLRDALKARTCYWTGLTLAEVKAHVIELDVRRSSGEVVRQPRKRRSDASITRKRKAAPTIGQGSKENKKPSKKVKKSPGQPRDAPKSIEFIQSSDEDDIEDE